MSSKSDLASFSEGMGFLARRPFVALGLALLGTILAALAPFLQIKAGLPNDKLVQSLLMFAALFPLDMYFVPRFLTEADASQGDRPGNPPEGWARKFDERWLKAMGAKFLIYAAAGIGFLCFIVPGLLILFAYGWAPWRILLRGESLQEAGRNSLRMMVLAWRRILGTVLVLVAVDMGLLIIASFALGLVEPDPLPWDQLTHPKVWILNFVSVALNLWTSATLLALFRRGEAASAEPPKGPAPID